MSAKLSPIENCKLFLLNIVHRNLVRKQKCYIYIYIYIKKKQNNTDGRNIVNIFCKKKEEIL